LSKTWGQSAWIDNKPGGQNVIGAQAAARSAPDGTTFYFATTAALVTNPLLFKQLPYNPQKDFVPVAFIARSPFALLVEANSPIKTLQDLVDRAKAAPGKVSLGNEGPRTFGGMISRLFAAREKIDLNQVAYPSVAVALQDTIGGHVDAVRGRRAVERRAGQVGQAPAAGSDDAQAPARPRGGSGARRDAAAGVRNGGLVRRRGADRNAAGGDPARQPGHQRTSDRARVRRSHCRDRADGRRPA
jgi:hypothetical protein